MRAKIKHGILTLTPDADEMQDVIEWFRVFSHKYKCDRPHANRETHIIVEHEDVAFIRRGYV